MINENSIFNEVRSNISLMCRDDCAGADLAAAAGLAISNKMKSVCVAPERVSEVWPWLENKKIKILSRFSVAMPINDDAMSVLSGNISACFRAGADGAIVFINMKNLQKFALEISNVRDDLFFNKTFGVGIDIEQIDVFDWNLLFGLLRIVRADSLVLRFTNDTGDKSDFVGRVFAMLDAARGDWGGAVNFVLGQNTVRLDQVYRLILKMKPDTISTTEFFIDNDM